MDETAQWKKLVRQAIEARNHAYAPYSQFKVGAALLTAGGNIYTGCNIENATFTPTVCAERTAIFKAVSEGEKEFVAAAIVTGPGGVAPCGTCRQVIREFAPNLTLILSDTGGNYEAYNFSDLFPHSFGPENLLNEEA